ncbi:MAG: hypothetical protein ACYTA5_12975 [Planctomycetota bacterium]
MKWLPTGKIRALNNVPPDKKPEAQKDVAICRAVYLYFKSISNQTRFLILRKQWQEQPQLLNQMSDIVREEIKLARQFYKIARSDSRVGYEPAMQYFHLPLDIREKIVSCRYILRKQIPDAANKAGIKLQSPK